jgi:hypothetical protein
LRQTHSCFTKQLYDASGKSVEGAMKIQMMAINANDEGVTKNVHKTLDKLWLR